MLKQRLRLLQAMSWEQLQGRGLARWPLAVETLDVVCAPPAHPAQISSSCSLRAGNSGPASNTPSASHR